MIKITYTTESGMIGECVLYDPHKIDHIWWSHSRNKLGKFEKHEVSILGAFLQKINSKFSIKSISEIEDEH